MGDLGPDLKKRREVHVLVTGAGPFGQNTINPAGLIAAELPSFLEPTDDKLFTKVNIHLHVTPDPWEVAYKWVDDKIPPMLFPPSRAQGNPEDANSKPKPNYDLVLFIGMAGPRLYYSAESQAHRDGYKFPDVHGLIPADPMARARLGAPETISTSLDTKKLLQRWQDQVPKEVDVRISNDAGHYLCDYIYYTGLCEYWIRNGKEMNGSRPVIFLHVPGDALTGSIERGVVAAKALIRAMVEDYVTANVQ